MHFESGDRGDVYRADQARELIEDAAGLQRGVVIGGDMNVGRYPGSRPADASREPAIGALVEGGYEDGHVALPREERVTTDSGAVMDLIFGRGVGFEASGVGPREVWGGLSDHLPVWARVSL